MRLDELFQDIQYLTLKLTNGCNLSCSYCNVEAVTPKTPKMSMETYKKLVRAYIENSTSPRVGLEFHGGEPMLLSDEWFEEAITYANTIAKEQAKQILEFPLVTNGTLLTEERLLKLHKLGVHFCLSSDGPPPINDILRGSGKAVERSMRLLRSHGIGFGVLTVMGASNYNRMSEVMDWFHSLGVVDFRINHLQPQGRGLESQLLTGAQMFEGVRQIFEHMVSTDVSVLEDEVFVHVERFVQGRPPRPHLSCWEYQCQAGRTYLAADHTGGLHLCGTDLMNHQIGHIDMELDESRYRRKLAKLHDRGSWELRCFDCNAKQICNHSCPTSDYNSDEFKQHSCEMTKKLWSYFCENPEKPRRVLETARRQRTPTVAMVASSEIERLWERQAVH